jgi:hypothetical protein
VELAFVELNKMSKARWKPDSEAPVCNGCSANFSSFRRRHHCRQCGGVFCNGCSKGRKQGVHGYSKPVRVCQGCKRSAEHTVSPPDYGSVGGRAFVPGGVALAAKNTARDGRNCSEAVLKQDVEQRLKHPVRDERMQIVTQACRAGSGAGGAINVDSAVFWEAGLDKYVTDTVSRWFDVGQPVLMDGAPGEKPALGKR